MARTTGRTGSGPELSVLYPKRMRPNRTYKVEASWAKAREEASVPKNTPPFVLRLVMGGAQVVPFERTIDPSDPKAKASFFVTPINRGWVKGSRLEIIQNGKKVDEVSLSAKTVTLRTTWVFLLLAFFLPWWLINVVQQWYDPKIAVQGQQRIVKPWEATLYNIKEHTGFDVADKDFRQDTAEFVSKYTFGGIYAPSREDRKKYQETVDKIANDAAEKLEQGPLELPEDPDLGKGWTTLSVSDFPATFDVLYDILHTDSIPLAKKIKREPDESAPEADPEQGQEPADPGQNPGEKKPKNRTLKAAGVGVGLGIRQKAKGATKRPARKGAQQQEAIVFPDANQKKQEGPKKLDSGTTRLYLPFWSCVVSLAFALLFCFLARVRFRRRKSAPLPLATA
ncbi:MAG: hypothetical protein ACFCD0_10815 [Gemmataceae bacterium]